MSMWWCYKTTYPILQIVEHHGFLIYGPMDVRQINQFNGMNFCTWKTRMKSVLLDKFFFGHVDNLEVWPTIPSNQSTWDKKNNKARTNILFAYVQFLHINKWKTQKEILDTLTKIYKTSHAQKTIHYIQKLYSLKILKEDTIVNHINTFHPLIDNLASMGTNISDNDNVIVFLGSLSKSYEEIVVSISGKSNLTLEGVTSLLLQEDIIKRKSKWRDIEDKP